MLEARRLVALPDNDFMYSSLMDAEAALKEIDDAVARMDTATLEVFFLPTGPLQELALSSGWGDEFVALADRFDAALAAHRGNAVYRCALCAKPAGRLTCADGVLRRESFTSVLTQAETPAVRAAIGDAKALHALDPELAPFYCPDCDRVYCGEHWARRDVFDGDHHDSIRGTCPEGHERLLED